MYKCGTGLGLSDLQSLNPGHRMLKPSCIVKWINQHTGNGAAKCPECNHTTTRRDIRKIWSKSVVVVDTVEMDLANTRIREEREARKRCEQELGKSRLAYELLNNELNDLQKELKRQRALKARYREEVKQLKMAHPEREIIRHFSYVNARMAPITSRAPGGTHYMSYRQDEEMLVYSRQMGEQYGIAKVSMRDFSSNFHDFTNVHTKPIKDTSILTLDLRNTRAPVSSFSNPGLLGHAPIHSMTHIGAFDGHDQEAILCGSLEGAFVYNFDSTTHTESLSGVMSQEMIISGSQGSTALGGDSLSSSQSMATAPSVGAADKERDCRLPVRLQGASCMSVSFDSFSRSWMASYNFLGGKSTQHVRGTIDEDPYTGDLLLRSEFKVMGATPVPWSRNSVFTRLNGSVHMAAGSDSVAHVWYDPRFRSKRAQEEENVRGQSTLTGGRPISTLDMGPLVQHALRSGNNPLPGTLIRDIKPVVISGMDEYLVTLSDKELGMYRWAESQPSGVGGIGDDGDSDDEDEMSEEVEDVDEPVLWKNKGKRRRLDGEEEDDDVIIVGENAGRGSGSGSGSGSGGGPSSTASSPMFNTQ
ncbi:RING finger and WD repeat domain-containing protein 3 [Linnemannia exigua]|uniref:RING finger and WD repeat domain-containing protein 3 n=1 Tax=Linnemannia exigua TaxID=604196 RepID=A0AAD4DIR5_9FUNG|nr:RING finger and WD repeat domain-containing protein 3 [Linnemannia exigua]